MSQNTAQFITHISAHLYVISLSIINYLLYSYYVYEYMSAIAVHTAQLVSYFVVS